MTLGVVNGATDSGHDKSTDPGTDNSKGDNGVLGSHIAPQPMMPVTKLGDTSAPPPAAPVPPTLLHMTTSDFTAELIE